MTRVRLKPEMSTVANINAIIKILRPPGLE